MLATRDQENLVHARQTAAASKPLNQGLRALQPKTPGPAKTPFRRPQNDENNPNGLKALGKNDGKPGVSVLATPLGPRTRAPLGAKTTNAKAQAFKTPAPLQQTAKPQKTLRRPSSTPRSAKPKIVVAPTQPVEIDILARDDDDDLPEIEYCPPQPKELPDPPMEFDYNQDFPQFEGKNFFRGYWDVYGSPEDENGFSIREKKEQKAWEQYLKDTDKGMTRKFEIKHDPLAADREVEAMLAAGPKARVAGSELDTFSAKSAASALAQLPPSSRLMKQTASSLQKKKQPVLTVYKTKPPPDLPNSSPMRHTAAAAVSRNTIGYPKAAKPRSIIPRIEQNTNHNGAGTPKQINQKDVHPKDFVDLYGEPPVDSDMWFRVQEYRHRQTSLEQEDDCFADNFGDTDFFAIGGQNDDKVFQLPTPD